MHFLSKALTYLHFSIVFVLFLGLLAVAGYSLFSLSPVAYEDYQAYKSKLNGENSNAPQVAGLSTGNLPTIYQNLLEKSGLDYQFTTNGSGAETKLKIQNAIDAKNIIEIGNPDSTSKAYEITLTYTDIPMAELKSDTGLKLEQSSSEVTASGGKHNYRIIIEDLGTTRLELHTGRPLGSGEVTVNITQTQLLRQLP